MTKYTRTLPDDVKANYPGGSRDLALTPVKSYFPALNSDRAIDALTALQYGLFQIVSVMDMYSIDRLALLSGRKESRKFNFKRVFFDWAETKDDRFPYNTVTIKQNGGCSYTYTNLEADILDGTENVFCQDTVLKRIYTCTTTLDCVVWLADKDDRAGVRRAFEESLDEPEADASGRRVVIEPYYNQVARYYLQGIDTADDPESAQDNTWPLIVSVSAEIDVVKLVRSPGLMKRPIVNIEIE